MSLKSIALCLLSALLGAFSAATSAQQPPPYGAPITLEQAQKAAVGAAAEARKNNWAMAIAVVNPAGHLVLLHTMDNTQYGSIHIAIRKAETAARFKRPSKVFQDLIAKGFDFQYLQGLEGAMPVQGGIPIVMDGKIVGAIGLSGGTGPQDTQCAEAGLAALK
jgi:uncharacterized protein GlcG (DUF336 family)